MWEWYRSTEALFIRISNGFRAIGLLCLLIMTLLITADVLLRSIFNKPIIGANEIVELLMLPLVFLVVSYTQHEKGHVTVTILSDRFKKRLKYAVDCFINFISLGIFLLFLKQSVAYFNLLWESSRETDVLKIVVYPFQCAMIIGITMLCLALLFDLICSIRGIKENE